MPIYAKSDLYQDITNKIITSMEEGTPPWRKPWTGGNQGVGFPLRSTSEAYRGINILMLWLTASDEEFLSQHWFTYKQAQLIGGQVRKGQKSTRVVYYSTLERENDQGEEVAIPYLKTFSVFNADQVDDLDEKFYRHPDPARDLGTIADPQLDSVFESTGANITTSDDPKAYYSPSEDHIHMPPICTFHDATGYYATLAHEAVHWTGSKQRLDRTHERKKTQYAFEELVAEIGACMVCARLGIAPNFPQSAAYIEGWLECLKEDKKAIFKAASLAQKAVDFLLDNGEAPQ
ncbi:MAG: ArdC family protein [Rhodothermales bacterium]